MEPLGKVLATTSGWRVNKATYNYYLGFCFIAKGQKMGTLKPHEWIDQRTRLGSKCHSIAVVRVLLIIPRKWLGLHYELKSKLL